MNHIRHLETVYRCERSVLATCVVDGATALRHPPRISPSVTVQRMQLISE